MKRPLWHLELVRTTDAPFDVVALALLEPQRTWHPRPGRSPLRVLSHTGDTLELAQTEAPCWGVQEEAIYRVEPHGDRLLLTYHARFKGWPVLLLMGYWRLKSHRIWERFVEGLG